MKARGTDLTMPTANQPLNAQPLVAESGVSLIELLMAMTIAGIVLSSAFQAMARFGDRFAAQQRTISQVQEVRIGLDVLGSELRLVSNGIQGSSASFTRASATEVMFYANVSGLETTTTQAVAMGQQELAVLDGSGWPAGKDVLLCSTDRCVSNRLVRDGHAHTLYLSSPLSEPIPLGATVLVQNRVRYYQKKDAEGSYRLMREVDGGVATLLAGLADLRFHYIGNNGQFTADLSRIACVSATVIPSVAISPITYDACVRT